MMLKLSVALLLSLAKIEKNVCSVLLAFDSVITFAFNLKVKGISFFDNLFSFLD